MQKNILLSRIILAVAILLAIVVVILGVVLVRNLFFGDDEVKLGESFTLASNEVIAFNNGYLVKEGASLAHYDKDGKSVFTATLKSADALIDVSSTRIAVCQNEELLVLDATGSTIYSKPLNMSPSDIVCGVNCIAILDEDRDTVYIINQTGSNIDTINVAGQTAINMGFYSTGDLIWISWLDASGAAPVTNISIYQPGESFIATKKFSDEIVYNFMVDLSANTGIAIGSKSVSSMAINASEITDYTIGIYGYQYADHFASSTKASLLLAPADQLLSGRINALRVVSGGKSIDVSLPSACSTVVAGEEYIYAASPAAIYTLSYEGQLVSTFTPEEAYTGVLSAGKATMLLVNGQNATIAKLPN